MRASSEGVLNLSRDIPGNNVCKTSRHHVMAEALLTLHHEQSFGHPILGHSTR
jgi:hypothetical protein